MLSESKAQNKNFYSIRRQAMYSIYVRQYLEYCRHPPKFYPWQWR